MFPALTRRAGWRVAETISPSVEPEDDEIEAVSAVMALQHGDWLGLAQSAVRRGAAVPLNTELVQGRYRTSRGSRWRD
jgi:hypothetical protein